MERNHIVSNLEIELNTNTASEQDPKSDIYEVMHMDSCSQRLFLRGSKDL